MEYVAGTLVPLHELLENRPGCLYWLWLWSFDGRSREEIVGGWTSMIRTEVVLWMNAIMLNRLCHYLSTALTCPLGMWLERRHSCSVERAARRVHWLSHNFYSIFPAVSVHGNKDVALLPSWYQSCTVLSSVANIESTRLPAVSSEGLVKLSSVTPIRLLEERHLVSLYHPSDKWTLIPFCLQLHRHGQSVFSITSPDHYVRLICDLCLKGLFVGMSVDFIFLQSRWNDISSPKQIVRCWRIL